MKKIILAVFAVVSTLGAAEVSNPSLCQSIGQGFGGSYAYSQKNLSPKQYCDWIVKEKSSNEAMCSFKELSEVCVNQIQNSNQK